MTGHTYPGNHSLHAQETGLQECLPITTIIRKQSPTSQELCKHCVVLRKRFNGRSKHYHDLCTAPAVDKERAGSATRGPRPFGIRRKGWFLPALDLLIVAVRKPFVPTTGLTSRRPVLEIHCLAGQQIKCLYVAVNWGGGDDLMV